MSEASLGALLDAAIAARGPTTRALLVEGTDCWRIFHGAVEGRPGLTVDRYGPRILVQTFREALSAPEVAELEARLGPLVWNHRGPGAGGHVSEPGLLEPTECREQAQRFRVRVRHRGEDPLLFLDFRAARRWLRANSAGKRVLNLFAYTCGAGVAAAGGGAREVLNVDFAASALEVGRENAALNGLRVDTLQEDVIPVLRQLAGLPIKGRGARRPYQRIAARRFDLVVLDPPTFARSPFGAVDIVRDYPSLLKPALLCAAPGGAVLATNHVATVGWEEWEAVLRRTGEKCGRPLESVERLDPEADFPSPDGRPPLKMAILRV